MRELQKIVTKAIQARKLFRSGERILVAVSGGADSIALLHLLHEKAAAGKWRMQVAHFNHQLRGRESDADERFVKQRAKRLKLPFVSGRGAVAEFALKQSVSIEMAARQLRHEFLAESAKQRRCSVIALAHHADDQVELFFLRLLRGAGSDGLAGMKWQSASPVDSSIRLVRPLLAVTKADLEGFLRKEGISHRSDSSNASRDILRNQLRLELLPLLRREYQPAIERSVLRMMELIGGEAEVITHQASSWLAATNRSPWSELPAATQRRVIQLQLQQLRIPVDFELVERLRTAPGKRVSAGHEQFLICDGRGEVRCETPRRFSNAEMKFELKLNSEQPASVSFGGCRVSWSFGRSQSGNQTTKPSGLEHFDAEKLGKQVVLRHWRAGDRFQPIGMKTAVKLQDWFTNQKISATRRRELLIGTTSTGEIFWIEGLRIGERFKLTAETRQVLQWRWHPENPGSPALRG